MNVLLNFFSELYEGYFFTSDCTSNIRDEMQHATRLDSSRPQPLPAVDCNQLVMGELWAVHHDCYN